MINKVADNDVEEMAQALSDSPQWLSKMQVCIYWYTIKELKSIQTDND